MVAGKTERRAPVFAPPSSEIPARLAALEKENHELKEALRNKPPIWSSISHDPMRRRAIIDRSGLVQKIELPKAVQRDLSWHTEGRMGAVDAAFNPSIFDTKDGRTWMLYRCECVPWFRYSKIAIVELDALFCPIPSTNQMLDLPTDWDGYNALDHGGIILITSPNCASAGAIERCLHGVSPFIYSPHVREYTAKELEWWVGQAGFRILERTTETCYEESDAAVMDMIARAGHSTDLRNDTTFIIATK